VLVATGRATERALATLVVAETAFAEAFFAAVFVTPAPCTTLLWTTLFVAPPELVWARATHTDATVRVPARQMRLTVFQLNFRAIYCASPKVICC
jgi:hypothetical protein